MKLILLFILYVYCYNDSNYINDLNVEFFSDYYLSTRRHDFQTKNRVYALFTLYKRRLNTTRLNCLKENDCLKTLNYNYNPLTIQPGSCPLSIYKKIFLVIESVYLITEDNSNRYMLYREHPRYYGVDRDSTITHYRYENSSYCVTQVVFSFILKRHHSEFGGSILPNIVIHYSYIISNQTVNISNYRHIGKLHQRKKVANNIYTCCTVENCGYFHPLSCFRFFEIDVSVISSFLFVIIALMCILQICHKRRKNNLMDKNDYNPIQLIKESDIDEELKKLKEIELSNNNKIELIEIGE